ncbi:MBOAT-2 domain-containing protein [Mycena venus]|uniref:MBOAT-2 domain-containing protein n=1 Tax=Mycena venus TaxID=2733690 RepID=A0A8H7CCG4_9AGAR|nr:MBOAT-2 domain-containing protein [Mycena venus]
MSPSLQQIDVLNHRLPLTLASFFRGFLPPVGPVSGCASIRLTILKALLYYGLNVLAILGPRTFLYRLALLPLTLFMAYRAMVSLDFARGFLSTDAGRLEYLNQAMVLTMFTVMTRSLVRTFSSQTPQRCREPSQQLALDAADLTFNLRGVGWNFSASMRVPAPTRSLAPTSAYLVATGKSLAIHIVAFDFLHYFGQLLDPQTVGIYDTTISDPLLRNLRAIVQTLIVGLCIYCAIHIGHDVFSVIGITLLGQSPSQWPPIFDAPWLATSLTEFWAARWHQIFRQEFLALGAKPLSLVAGRPGGVLGAFLASGTLHFVGLWGMGKGTDIRVIYFFLMMGVGVVLEGFWRRFTGRRVGGWMGWVWSCVWLVGCGPLMADPWCLSGIMHSVFLPPIVRPSVWLHKLATSILHS